MKNGFLNDLLPLPTYTGPVKVKCLTRLRSATMDDRNHLGLLNIITIGVTYTYFPSHSQATEHSVGCLMPKSS